MPAHLAHASEKDLAMNTYTIVYHPRFRTNFLQSDFVVMGVSETAVRSRFEADHPDHVIEYVRKW